MAAGDRAEPQEPTAIRSPAVIAVFDHLEAFGEGEVATVAHEGKAIGGRIRLERGIYRQPNGKCAVCFMREGKPRFGTVGSDLDEARSKREALVAAARAALP